MVKKFSLELTIFELDRLLILTEQDFREKVQKAKEVEQEISRIKADILLAQASISNQGDNLEERELLLTEITDAMSEVDSLRGYLEDAKTTKRT
jgi:hypothetical protein